MATAVSKPPSAPQNNAMKRPPVPNVKTGASGPRPAGAAQSPSTPSKRPPSTTPTTTASAGMNGINGAHARAPIRRASQKPGDAASKNARPVKADGIAAPMLRGPEPYVRTAECILSKYAKRPPSLIIHLHPTHFRFDQQDGSWSYQSQMKVILEYVKQQTVPADMVDELLRSGIQFYEGCLIVQVRDHRHAAASKERVSKDDQKENNQPFSMHKHSKFLVPSPHVPYPVSKQISSEKLGQGADDSKGASAAQSAQKAADKESETKPDTSEERVFTTVLFPALANINTELLDFAAWADNLMYQKSKRANPGQKGAATAAPPAKRQKFLSDVTKLQEVEAKVISALAPPLYLDPVDNMDEAQELLRKLRDPRFNEEPPAPKSRKRTIAELAADEALAAEEQRFMLIMDERLQPSAAGTTAADMDTGGATFEPRFERFKAIEEIRRQHQERQREEAEQKAHARAEQERVLRERQGHVLERQKQENLARQHSQQQAAHPRAPHGTQQAIPHGHGHIPPAKNNVQNVAQSYSAAPNHQGSPALRNMTPHNASSPIAGTPMAPSHSQQGGVAMMPNNSRQGSGSPPRPGSAVQHGHPQMQPPSRNGTPQIPAGTPRMPQAATPVMRNVSSATPHMSPAVVTAATPGQAPAMVNMPNGRPQPTQQQLAAFRHQQLMRQQAQNQHMQQQQAALARSQGSPPMQMSPNMNGAMKQHHHPNAQQMAAVQAQGRQVNPNAAAAYSQQMSRMASQQMPNGQMPGMGGMPNQMQQPGQQHFNPQMHPQSNGRQQTLTPQHQAMQAHAHAVQVSLFNKARSEAMQNGQTLTPETEANLRNQAKITAINLTKAHFGMGGHGPMNTAQAQQLRIAQAQAAQARAQAQNQMMMGNMNHGNM